jgi:hypothetical protein
LVHVVPQAPQLAESDFSSTHAPLQAESPLAQVAAHAPLLHTGVAPVHGVPQAPQLPGSLVASTHVPPQSFVPAGQTHLPPLHSCEAPQAVPHAPQ